MLAFFPASDAVLLLKVSLSYLSNSASPKGEFPCRPFHFTVYGCVQGLHGLFSAIRSFNNDAFAGNGVTGLLASEVLLTPSMKTTLLNFVLNSMKLFVHKSGNRRKVAEDQILTKQR